MLTIAMRRADHGGALVGRAAARVWRALNPRSTARLNWKRQGNHITFKWGGFVAAPNAPMLFARHHYEVLTIRRVLRDMEIASSLEFGCGYGRLSPTFAALSRQHTGVDINAEALVAARWAYPDLVFQEVDGDRLPFPDGSFSLVAAWTVLQHVSPDKIGSVLAEIRRVLSATGVVLLCEETRNPGVVAQHTWHRTPEFYAHALEPLQLAYSEFIKEIDRLPGLNSPGRVMLFGH